MEILNSYWSKWHIFTCTLFREKCSSHGIVSSAYSGIEFHHSCRRDVHSIAYIKISTTENGWGIRDNPKYLDNAETKHKVFTIPCFYNLSSFMS